MSSLIYQRFPSYSDFLIDQTRRIITVPPTYNGINQEQKDKEEAIRLQKQKTALRLMIEFNLCNLVDPKKHKLSTIQNILQEMFGVDKELCNLTLASTFLKNFGAVFITPLTKITPDQENRFVLQLFLGYFEQVSGTLVRVHGKIKDIEKFNAEYLMTKGELSEERKEKYAQMKVVYGKLVQGSRLLSEQLGSLLISISLRLISRSRNARLG